MTKGAVDVVWRGLDAPAITISATGIVAANGEQATAEIERLDPDIVLLDLQLPGGSGMDVLRALRKQERAIARMARSGVSPARASCAGRATRRSQ